MASAVSSVKVVAVRVQVISGTQWSLTRSNRCAERLGKAVRGQLAEWEDAPAESSVARTPVPTGQC